MSKVVYHLLILSLLLPHSSLLSSSSLLMSSFMGVVTILGMGDTVAMLRSVLAVPSLSPTGTKWNNNTERGQSKSHSQNLLQQQNDPTVTEIHFYDNEAQSVFTQGTKPQAEKKITEPVFPELPSGNSTVQRTGPTSRTLLSCFREIHVSFWLTFNV